MIKLKGNQHIVFRQLLKANKFSIFIDDVCNFTDLKPSQVRSAFSSLITKGLVLNISSSKSEMNQYVLAY